MSVLRGKKELGMLLLSFFFCISFRQTFGRMESRFVASNHAYFGTENHVTIHAYFAMKKIQEGAI